MQIKNIIERFSILFVYQDETNGIRIRKNQDVVQNAEHSGYELEDKVINKNSSGKELIEMLQKLNDTN
ncbi:hypothetical protein SanaruYs_03090 [Chryseotalea sanaruensis]|uniref:Uncharacterized protein n=1 Tax=Chryseotalea sanaruensis TaxID=2482724 RepID=A0A401U555_9BACT|nr:hypothetical protein [Chryseotalea sanaruensis]GCC50094.1 hypothetical protein SanaruYs_03090 [Chryseotalea sanaruensis]